MSPTEIVTLPAMTAPLSSTRLMRSDNSSGVLSTASDLVFAGGREGYFFALDARTGALLWRSMLGGQIASGPMAYALDGRQYIAVSAGNNMFVFALRE